ncbi:MAG: hypothetical protein AAGH82_06130 [Pseudomonadota bacterium]
MGTSATKITVTTWNIKWFGQLLQGRKRSMPGWSKDDQGRYFDQLTAPTDLQTQALEREMIAEQIRRINPTILCIQEGPSLKLIPLLVEFCEVDLEGKWTLVRHPTNAFDDYKINGQRGIYFLVATDMWAALNPRLMPVTRWYEATARRSRTFAAPEGEHGETWSVNHPHFKGSKPRQSVWAKWSDEKKRNYLEFANIGAVDPPERLEDVLPVNFDPKEHRHYRHPQTLTCTIGGRRLDLIGVHFKSKYISPALNNKAELLHLRKLTRKQRSELEEAEREAVEARIKITTEVTNVRYFIEDRFDEEPNPAIMVLGDFNDGIGKEYFERRYLFHDMISNLQGDIFTPERYLNHALFDYGQSGADDFRWTHRFHDKWDSDPNNVVERGLLIDHIMFTQSMVGNADFSKSTFNISAGAGRVEHEFHAAVNALFATDKDGTSDHRPVSVDVHVAGPVDVA